MKTLVSSSYIVVCASVVFLIGACLCDQVYASGFRNPPDGAAALGRGGGRLTLTDDASLISHNPAGLTGLEDAEAMVSFTLVNADAEFDSVVPPGGSAKTSGDVQWLPSLFVATPLGKGPYAAGLSLTVPYGQATEWSQDSLFRYTAPYFVEMKTIDVSPALAANLNEYLSIGLALDVMISDIDFRQVFPWSSLPGMPPVVPDGEATFEAEGEGVGAHAGLLWKATERQSLALTYRAPVKIEYEGDFSVSGMPPGAPIPISSSDFNTLIGFPSVIAAGYGLEVREDLRIGFDVEWVEFSRYDKLDLDVGLLSSLLPQGTLPQIWNDSWTVGLGADWDVSEALTLRGGYQFVESPIPSATLAPTLPDADRHIVSVGAGYRWKGHRLDAGYAYSIFDERRVGDSPNPFYNGTYDLCSHLVGLSYGYAF